MPLPGFTAEASLGPMTQVYRVQQRYGYSGTSALYPQWNGGYMDMVSGDYPNLDMAEDPGLEMTEDEIEIMEDDLGPQSLGDEMLIESEEIEIETDEGAAMLSGSEDLGSM